MRLGCDGRRDGEARLDGLRVRSGEFRAKREAGTAGSAPTSFEETPMPIGRALLAAAEVAASADRKSRQIGRLAGAR